MPATKICRIALAQINPIVGDFDYNVAGIADAIHRAQQAKADVVLLPELALCGYPPEDLVYKPSFMQENQRRLRELANEVGDIVAVVGFADRNGGIFNAAAVLYRGEIAAVYHKICLPNYDVFDEKRTFQTGIRPLVLEMDGIKIGINICEDIWQSGVAEHQALKGDATLLCNISASPYHVNRWNDRRETFSHRSRLCQAHLAYVNMVGGQDDLVFDGGSFILGPDGDVLALAPFFEEHLLVADLPLALRDRNASRFYFQQEFQLEKVKLKRSIPKKTTAASGGQAEPPDTLDEILQALITGTRDYVRKNGFKKVVIGLSGGIDSALTAAIAERALGAENVIGVLMPSRFTSRDSLADAVALAKNLRIQTYTVGIEKIVTAYENELAPLFEGTSRDITEENLQARARGNLLMALSNKFGWLVLTTGNKSETSVGYCTLYGDMAGGFAVLKDVLKTLVYRLSRHLNRASEVIPRRILEKPPSAELRPDQKDADSLPPYEILDKILSEYVELDRSVPEIVQMGIDAATVRRTVKLVDLNEYKRRQAPPGIRITPKAFGRDRRMPITNHFTSVEISNGTA